MQKGEKERFEKPVVCCCHAQIQKGSTLPTRNIATFRMFFTYLNDSQLLGFFAFDCVPRWIFYKNADTLKSRWVLSDEIFKLFMKRCNSSILQSVVDFPLILLYWLLPEGNQCAYFSFRRDICSKYVYSGLAAFARSVLLHSLAGDEPRSSSWESRSRALSSHQSVECEEKHKFRHNKLCQKWPVPLLPQQ